MGQALMEDARSRNICRVRRMNSLKELTKAGPPWLIGHRCKGEGGGPESPSSIKCPPPPKNNTKKNHTHNYQLYNMQVFALTLYNLLIVTVVCLILYVQSNVYIVIYKSMQFIAKEIL